MSPRRANPDAHEALIDAALEEFGRRGVIGARVEDISRRAGVSKGAFYLHFRTKEGAFREIVQRLLGLLADLAARREEQLRTEGDAPWSLPELLERERACDLELLEALWRNRKVLAALDGATAGPAAALALDFRRRMRSLVSRRVGARRADGTLRTDLDPDALGDLLLGAYETFGRRMAETKAKPDLEGWARALSAAFYEGMLTRRSATSARS